MRFGSTAKVLAKCKLKYYRISECLQGAWVKVEVIQHHCSHEECGVQSRDQLLPQQVVKLTGSALVRPHQD